MVVVGEIGGGREGGEVGQKVGGRLGWVGVGCGKEGMMIGWLVKAGNVCRRISVLAFLQNKTYYCSRLD